ncbi:MAG: ABC transporter permease [Actinomycetota bacterium]|nr:ABC transporter permease [Actinomycetota bacterium]
MPVAARPSLGRRKAIGFSVALLVMGIVGFVAFGLGSASGLDTTFIFSPRNEALLDLTFPSRSWAMILSGLVIGLGLAELLRNPPRRAYILLLAGIALFVTALLVWAARDSTLSIFGLLNGSIRRSIPIGLGAMAGLLCERSGVINIAIEGMMLAGAFVGSVIGSAAGSVWVGLAGGAAIGALLGLFLATLSIRYVVDQIVGATVINILAIGLTSFLTAQVLVEHPDLNRPGGFRPFAIPLLVEIPIVGPLFFDNTIYVYLLFGLAGFLTWALFQSRWGLRLRSVGEHPRAADTVGIRVNATRYKAVTLGGIVAGVAGTFFTLDATGGFDEEMTAGRGFIALAALIFGRYHPIGALMAALVFGFSEELQDRLALLSTPIPSEFLLMTPYIVTIVVVAGLVGRARPPAADGQPYTTG